ncbi:MAG: DNA gyrase subunit A [Spirochaetota bacterium]|uniref:DNA gyrase subunit A n=1 Tax=Candidatus Avelusimicrobium faecicola TaxID=3416205 RepID=UPI002A5F13E2|nr:DNA gyrase subunit A [Spirochaetota bacterium]MDY2939831.1 DNA gyrase subunit A [Elusimicrobiaceae bacterium]MDY6128562.1 DNA gyrase subunit A [Elusimicrobiaceae bacterium]
MSEETNNQPQAQNANVDLFGNIQERDIAGEMRSYYIDYAMSVIVGRALPDVRDGLKPVHRRVLYSMNEMGLKYNKAYKKSARVVGDVLGKYHPHGDTAVYDTLVRMVQDFSLRKPLIDGQGNFGSIDGDSAAAMRYTECRLQRIADEMLNDLDKDTVKMIPNYDGSLLEPSVLPGKLPALLVNGSSGIAVGMATNIPTHNLGEVCDGIIEYIKNPNISTKDMMKIIKGPDFPTGAIIRGTKGIYEYFETGRGSVKVQARTEIEERKGGREAIIVTEIPYQVNKTSLIETIVGLVRDKKITDISDIRDESDRRGMRLVIEVKRDGNAQVVLNHLFKHTQLQTSFPVNMLAIVDGRPRILSLKEVMKAYVKHRKEIITNRTKFDLNKAQRREHILQGLLIAIANLDEVVSIIRNSKDPTEAKFKLMSQFSLSELQAQAILDMRLHQLTQLSADAIANEQAELLKLIAELQGILADPQKILDIIVTELTELKKNYGDPRRTEIGVDMTDFSMEDLIEKEDVVITISNDGYAKRIPLDTYRSQNRGGKGIIGGKTKEEDFMEHLFVTSSHATILMFTNRGRVFALRAFEIPEGNRMSKGKAIVNLLQLVGEEKVTSAVSIDNFDPKHCENTFLTMCTRYGSIKRVALEEFANIRKTGIIAMGLEEGDVLTSVQTTHGTSDIIVATKNGKSIRFDENQVRAMGRPAKGVRAISLMEGDVVVGMEQAPNDAPQPDVLSVCENGFGKRTEFSEYKRQNRGGMGVITIKTSERNGKVVGIKLVDESKDLMIVTEKGMTIRVRCEDIRSVGRNAQGVTLAKLEPGDKIARIAPVVKAEEEQTDSKAE